MASLISRITDVVTSIATDIKALNNFRMMAFHLESPTVANKKIIMGKARTARTISSIHAVVPDGNGTANVTIKFFHGASVASGGTAIITAGLTISNNSTGQTFTTFDDPNILANDFVWFQITAKSGTVTDLAVSIWF